MAVEDPRQKSSDTKSDDPTDSEGYSPPCYLREASAVYAGYLTGPELIDILNELLEGERAGARATIQFVGESQDHPQLQTLMRKVSIDEARCCAMLAGHIRALGGMPSAETGAFYRRLVAISDVRDRLAYLNRGQGWVVRKLQDVLRGVRDDRLYNDLKTMLRDHEANIRRCNRYLEATKPDAAPAS